MRHIDALTPNRTPSHLNLEILPISLVPAPGDRAIMHADARDGAPGPQEPEGRLQRRAVAHDLDHHVHAAAIRQLRNAGGEPISIFQIVPGLGAQALRPLQTRRNPVDGEDGFWSVVLERGDQRAEAHGPASDEHHHTLADLVRRDLPQRVVRREVARRENVGHEAELELIDAAGGFDSRRIGERHPHVLGLPAVEQRTPEEQTLLASRREPSAAVEARAAADREGTHHGVAGPQRLDARAHFVHGPGELVAHDEAGRGCLVAPVHV